ncbi:MAG: carbamate kinase [Alphaproteobacteria bacterium]|jgi:carbamate kinase
MRLVIALGGNALSPADAPFDLAVQRERIRATAANIAALRDAHEIVVTHGSGPQVGFVAGLAAPGAAPPAFPLDIVDAETDALIGYEIERALRGARPDMPVATLLTLIEVDPADPAFAKPTKPIGPVYPAAQHADLQRAHGWALHQVPGGVRRVVASPRPRRILEIPAVRALLDCGHLVIACGGGGIPVAPGEDGLAGIEAVIDKDHASALLAAEIGADALLLATDIDGVYRDWPEPCRDRIDAIDADTLAAMPLAAGSMGPKVAAACDFVRAGTGFAAIGRLEDLPALLAREAGTIVTAA